MNKQGILAQKKTLNTVVTIFLKETSDHNFKVFQLYAEIIHPLGSYFMVSKGGTIHQKAVITM